ncbi:MAG: IS3 family transposase, partial [Sphingobacteriaceae bacterium]
KADIKISMDGKGRWVDNVFIERVWRSMKYECVYLNEYETTQQAKESIANYFEFYNTIRSYNKMLCIAR